MANHNGPTTSHNGASGPQTWEPGRGEQKPYIALGEFLRGRGEPFRELDPASDPECIDATDANRDCEEFNDWLYRGETIPGCSCGCNC